MRRMIGTLWACVFAVALATTASAQDYSDCPGLKRQIDQLNQQINDMGSAGVAGGSDDAGNQAGSMVAVRNEYVRLYDTLCTGGSSSSGNSSSAPSDRTIGTITSVLGVIDALAQASQRQSRRNAFEAQNQYYWQLMKDGKCQAAVDGYDILIAQSNDQALVRNRAVAFECAREAASAERMNQKMDAAADDLARQFAASRRKSPGNYDARAQLAKFRGNGLSACPTQDEIETMCGDSVVTSQGGATVHSGEAGICTLAVLTEAWKSTACIRERMEEEVRFKKKLGEARLATDEAISRYNCETGRDPSDCGQNED